MTRGGSSRDGSSASHPSFAKASANIARKEGVSQKAADAILANATRHASPVAKRENLNLKHVKGK